MNIYKCSWIATRANGESEKGTAVVHAEAPLDARFLLLERLFAQYSLAVTSLPVQIGMTVSPNTGVSLSTPDKAGPADLEILANAL